MSFKNNQNKTLKPNKEQTLKENSALKHGSGQILGQQKNEQIIKRKEIRKDHQK